jgi:hypothetical protein
MQHVHNIKFGCDLHHRDPREHIYARYTWVRARPFFEGDIMVRAVQPAEFSVWLSCGARLVICISIFGFACRVDIAMVNYFIIPSVLAGGAAAIGSPGCVSRLLPPRAVFSSTPAKERERTVCLWCPRYTSQLLLHAIPPRIKTTPRDKHPSHNWRECVHVKKLKARDARDHFSALAALLGLARKRLSRAHSSIRARTQPLIISSAFVPWSSSFQRAPLPI